jgi:hypothetical protein
MEKVKVLFEIDGELHTRTIMEEKMLKEEYAPLFAETEIADIKNMLEKGNRNVIMIIKELSKAIELQFPD